MMGLPGQKVLQMKMCLFHKCLLVSFQRKKYLARFGPPMAQNRISVVPIFFSKLIKHGFLGNFMVEYFFNNVETIVWAPPNLVLNQFKVGFLAMPNFYLSMVFFFQDNFGSGAIFSEPNNSTPKLKLTGHPSKKNTLTWHTKIGSWSSACMECAMGQLAKLTNHPYKWAKFGGK